MSEINFRAPQRARRTTESQARKPAESSSPAAARDTSSANQPTPSSGAATDGERYAVVGEHARGGLGRILEAADLRLKRSVALKELLRPDEDEEARFMREALIIARLQHPAIIPIQDVGRWPSGKPYYAMKLVSGRSLAEMIDEKKSVRERLALLPNIIAVSDAMAYAHSQRIIHRDLNPANVLIGPFGETVVIDWGLAADLSNPSGSPVPPRKSLSARNGAGPRLTIEGAVLGTAEYMPVEQAQGREVDERADVYALGAMLYHLLAGVPPYDGENSAAIMEKVIQGPPLALERQQRGLPDELITIVRKAMAREARDRYSTAKELAEDLKRFETGQLVSTHAYTSWALARRWTRRNRTAAGVAAICAVALIGMALASGKNFLHEKLTEASRNELLRIQARSSLDRDPTASIAWLKKYPTGGTDWKSLRDIAVEAQHQGIARHVFGNDGALIDYSPDGKILATYNGLEIQLWNVEDGSQVRTLPHRTGIARFRFSPDGKRLLFYDRDSVTLSVINLSNGEVRVLWGHEGAIQDAMFSPDGALIASASADKTVRLWSLNDAPTRVLAGHDGIVSRLAFTRDGKWLASAGFDQVIRVWGEKTSQALQLKGHGGKVLALAFSSDDSVLATSSSDGTVRVWNWRNQIELSKTRPPGKAWDLAFSPDNRVLALGTDNGSMVFWDFHTGEINTIRRHADEITSLAFSPDGQYLVSGGQDGTVGLWDAEKQEMLKLLHGHAGPVTQVLFQPDGKSFASQSWDKTVRVWSRPSRDLRILRGHTDAVMHAVFSPDGQTLATAGRDNAVRVWDVQSGRQREFKGHGELIYRLAFSPDGSKIASASWDKTVRLWDIRTGAGQVLTGHENAVWDVVFSPGGDLLASASVDGTIRLWNPNSGQSRILRRHDGEVHTIAFSPDGRLLASGGMDKVVRIWDVQTGASRSFEGHGGFVTKVAFSPTGPLVVSSSFDHSVILWDVNSGDGRVLAGHSDRVRSVAFSSDGKLVASAGEDRTIRIWNVLSGKSQVLLGHKDQIFDVSFSPDGKLLASAAGDNTARIWEVSTGLSLDVVRHQSLVRHAAFSPNGQLLSSVSTDGIVQLWPVNLATRVPVELAGLRRWFGDATTATIASGQDSSHPLTVRLQ